MRTMVLFRGPLIEYMVAQGHEVIAICPDGDAGGAETLRALGAQYIDLPSLSRDGLNPRSELKVVADLTSVLNDVQPDCLFSFFLKPIIWGSIAARRANIPRSVGMIEGMGFAFSYPAPGLKTRLRQKVISQVILRLFRIALKRLDHLIVLNNADANLVLRRRMIAPEQLTVLDGIGVDLSHFARCSPQKDPLVFTLAARLIREKGIEDFVQAARRVRAQAPHACFRLLGEADDAPGTLRTLDIQRWVDEGLIEWPGRVSDIRPALSTSSVFVLPTRYREGLPRSIMEAMAMGRPVITSNMPGAGDAITHGQSGYVHPVADINALIEACMNFVQNPDLVVTMGEQAYNEACQRYEISKQNQTQLDLILGPTTIPSLP